MQSIGLTLHQLAELNDKRLEPSEKVEPDALSYLQSIYNNPTLSEHVRMRAARDALPFERPKLQATAISFDGSFADRLEACIKRSQPKLIEAQAIDETS